MRTIVAAGLAVLVVLVPACGGSNEGYLSTATVRTALQQAGFTDLRVISQKRLGDELSEQIDCEERPADEICIELGGDATPDEDTIFAGPIDEGWPTLLAARMESTGMAKETFERVYNSKTISEDLAQAR